MSRVDNCRGASARASRRSMLPIALPLAWKSPRDVARFVSRKVGGLPPNTHDIAVTGPIRRPTSRAPPRRALVVCPRHEVLDADLHATSAIRVRFVVTLARASGFHIGATALRDTPTALAS